MQSNLSALKSRRGLRVLALLLCAAPAVSARASDGADWPQWRGPERTGVSAESDWNPIGKPEPLWRKSLGLGHSSFAVAGGRAYTLGYSTETGLDTIYCLDALSGAEIWTHSYPSEIWDMAHDGGALTTPSVEDGKVYSSNREGNVFCLNADDGAVLWHRDLRSEMELEPPTWGFSASPLLMGDALVLNFGKVVTLDKATGEDAWATEKNYGIAYSTPSIFERNGSQYIASLSGDGLVVLNSADGSEVDFYSWVKQPQIYPMTPVILGDRIFVSGGYDRGCVMLGFDGEKLEELWASRVMRNKMSGCVLWKDHLFGFDEAILKCIAPDGTMRWRERGLGTGSMTIAGGRLLILDGKGQIIVAEANPEEYVELSRQDVFDDGTSWSTPILSHGLVYCRSSLGEMACLDFRGDGTSVAAKAEPDAGMELPPADALVARHVDAIGGRASVEKVRAVHLSGSAESLRNRVLKGAVDLNWVSGAGFLWREETGFELGVTPELGWELGERAGPIVLEGEGLEALREAGDFQRLFDPASAYVNLKTSGSAVFDNRDCYSVSATTHQGRDRTLYFERESGLLAGHDGDGVLMWTLRGYREFDGVMLPTEWALYEPEKGERNAAVFTSAVINPPDDDETFATPQIIKLFTRTPEEIQAANERLAAEHAEYLGEWRSDETEEDAPNAQFIVKDGFLMFDSRVRDPAALGEPNEEGVFSIIGAEYVLFIPVRGEGGELEAIELTVAGNLRQTLKRP